MRPVFTIISPTSNCRPKLEKTLTSVLSQSCPDFEYLFMDGASSDGTPEWLGGVTDDRVRTFSEPDTGLYDAMNKGIARAQGRYLFFLGAGDILLPDVLLRIRELLPRDESSLIYGNVLWAGYTYGGPFSRAELCHRNICHQAIFYGREIFEIIGSYDLQYRYLADWQFNMRCFGEARISTRYVSIAVTIYESGGISRHEDTAFQRDKRTLMRRHLGLLAYLRFKLFGWRRTLLPRVAAFVFRRKPSPL